jgi:hypothetical protein
MRTWPNDRLFSRQPVDENVQEASHDQAEQSRRNGAESAERSGSGACPDELPDQAVLREDASGWRDHQNSKTRAISETADPM